MNRLIRTLSLGAAFVLGTAAFAQPLPPYDLTIAGYISGCNPVGTNFVNIQTVQGTQPALDIDVPVDGNCGFSVDLTMDSYQGWFMISTPCNGAILSETVSYTINALQPDSNYVYVAINCASTIPDCEGNPGGPSLPGTPCNDNDPATIVDTWSSDCLCAGLDSMMYDCLGILGGPNTFGTPCVDPATGLTGTWNNACYCVSDTVTVDCLQIPYGPNVPGTPCTFTGGGMVFTGTWTADCACDTSSTIYDCMQVPNGPDMPGTPCTNPATGVSGTWSALCECLPNVGPNCQANFYVLQAYENGDTTGTGVPVPNTLWVWNLSSGGSGLYQFLWSFGDGTSSTEAFPTHTYAGSGPYTLCLTISDSEGCTSTACDTISVDDDGIYNGLIGSGGNRSTLTVNVVNPLAMNIAESTLSTISLWPNPAREQLNIALDSRLDGAVNMEVIDLNGRVVMTQQERSVAGNNRFVLSTEGIPAGLYALRISNGSNTITQRFVRD